MIFCQHQFAGVIPERSGFGETAAINVGHQNLRAIIFENYSASVGFSFVGGWFHFGGAVGVIHLISQCAKIRTKDFPYRR